MCWSAPGESERGPRQRRSALGDLAQLDADDRERASCKSAQAHSEGAGNPRPNRCGGGAAHVRAWRGQYEPRGCPRGGRSWCFAGLPLGDLRRKADPGRLAVALLAAVQGGTLLRSCAAAHLTLKRCWTRSLIESRTSGPGELNSASRGVPSSRRPPGRHSA